MILTSSLSPNNIRLWKSICLAVNLGITALSKLFVCGLNCPSGWH